MKRFLSITLTLLLALAFASANSFTVFADEGEDQHDEHALEMEVNGYHVTLANQNDWRKGDNTLRVTLIDSMGSPVSGADVELVIEPKSDDHAVAEESHGAPEHDAEAGHDSMPEVEIKEHATESAHSSHEEEQDNAISVRETDEAGVYLAETYLASSGSHEVTIMFHVNDEMLQAAFVVEVPGVPSKTIVLWSFAAINIVLIASAGFLKKQSIPVKGQ
jgi:hypothetical protein